MSLKFHPNRLCVQAWWLLTCCRPWLWCSVALTCCVPPGIPPTPLLTFWRNVLDRKCRWSSCIRTSYQVSRLRLSLRVSWCIKKSYDYCSISTAFIGWFIHSLYGDNIFNQPDGLTVSLCSVVFVLEKEKHREGKKVVLLQVISMLQYWNKEHFLKKLFCCNFSFYLSILGRYKLFPADFHARVLK